MPRYLQLSTFPPIKGTDIQIHPSKIHDHLIYFGQILKELVVSTIFL